MATRSPNYPSTSLSVALEGVRRIWSEEKRSPFPASVAVRHLGFNSVNGTSRSHLAGLKQLGLIRDQGNNSLVLTPLAIKIMAHPEGSSERQAAIREAALTPKLFKRLSETHRDGSDATLRAYLITNMGFGEEGAKRAVKAFRDTMRLSGLDEAANLAGHLTDKPEEKPAEQDRPMPSPSTLRSPSRDEIGRLLASKTAADLAVLGVPVPGVGKELRFNISRDTEAQIIFSGPVTQEAIEKLAALLELQKDTFPTKAELQRPRSGVWRNKDHEQPVTITADLGIGQDGRRYFSAQETKTGIPEDELEFAVEDEGK